MLLLLARGSISDETFAMIPFLMGKGIASGLESKKVDKPGVNILSIEPLGPSFQQKNEFLKSVQKQKS